ncbi:MAG: lytic transglycosylase domain-containing protein [Thermomonas sp.]|uniref:lytic transglycosylase domain-containing protein n=1 Tax=Thermomonas sp. TaxID=1971895 RepID=UPI0039E3DC28
MKRALPLLLAMALCGAAHAQVFEVGDDGVMQRIDAPDARGPAGADDDGPAPAIPAQYRDALHAAAARYDISPWLLDAVARSESAYHADAVSAAGAIGIMQLMPATARELGVDPRDPAQNILGGAAYLRQMLDRHDGNLDLALAAYNAGSGSVWRYGGVPPYRETRTYVQRNLERLARGADAAPTSVTSTGGLP